MEYNKDSMKSNQVLQQPACSRNNYLGRTSLAILFKDQDKQVFINLTNGGQLMKSTRLVLFFLAAAFFLMAVGCSEQKTSMQEEKPKPTAAEVKKEAKDLVETTESYTMEQKQVYEQQLVQQLEEYSQKISALKDQVAMMPGEAKTAMQEQINMLDTDLQDMEAKAGEMKDASGQAWEDMKQGMEQAEKDLNQAISNAMQNFQKPPTKY
jgi:hypothetical protein